MKKQKRKMPQTRALALGFAAIILAGTLLLMMPFATRDGHVSFLNALFTATSATCVTGLVVADTYQNWTLFGQLVILGLIQIGGIGFMTIGVYVAVLLKKKIGLKEREFLHESVSTLEVAGVVRLTKRIVQGTVFFELVGAVLLAIRFVPAKGVLKGIYYSVFHSVSAFCNAGFDLMGDTESYSSFVSYEGDVLVNLTLMGLILIGGIGFIVWDDIYRNRLNFRRYLLHSKIVLLMTLFLTAAGTVLFLVVEQGGVLSGMNGVERLMGAMFASVTPRTAGFNTTDVGAMTGAGKLLTILLMFIGGSPGSTAGGIKTTTFAVMILSALATIRNSYGTNIFRRRLEEDVIKRASTVFTINLSLAVTAAVILVALQPLPLDDVLVEVVSAISTVGMSSGITRELCALSRVVIIFLMYCGRLGSLTFALSFARKKDVPPVQQPAEKIVVG